MPVDKKRWDFDSKALIATLLSYCTLLVARIESSVVPTVLFSRDFLLFFELFEETHPLPLPLEVNEQLGIEDGTLDGLLDTDGALLLDGSNEGLALIEGF